jgi:hypothetical protein
LERPYKFCFLKYIKTDISWDLSFLLGLFIYGIQEMPTESSLYKLTHRSMQMGCKAIQHTAESRVFIRAISAVLVSIAHQLGAGTVAIPALELSQAAEAMRTQGWFI